MAAVDRESPMLGEEFVAFDSDSESQGEAVDLSTADMDTACHRAVNDDMIYNNLEAGEETMAQLKGAGSVNGFLSNQGLQPRSYLMRLHVKTLPEVGVCLNDGTVMGARAVAADQSHAAMGGEQQERAESASQASGGNQGTVPVMDPAVHHQLTLAKGCPLHVPYDPRITILFDLNGVLFIDKRERQIRNGIEALMNLPKERFRLGIYSSRTLVNIEPAIRAVHQRLNLHVPLFDPAIKMSRNQCIPIPQGHQIPGANPWDVVKPLEPTFPGAWLAQVILVDDDSFKAVQGEEANMLLVPSCKNKSGADTVLEDLVQGLLGIHPGHDVRNHTKHISANVFANWRADACEAVHSNKLQGTNAGEPAGEGTECAGGKVTLQASGADLPPKPCGGSQFYAVLADACGCSGIHFDLKSAIKAKTPQGLANSSGHEGITLFERYELARDHLNKNLGIQCEWIAPEGAENGRSSRDVQEMFYVIQSRKGPILISTRGVLGPHDSATMSGPFLMRSQGQKALAGLMSQLHPPLSAGAEHEARFFAVLYGSRGSGIYLKKSTAVKKLEGKANELSTGSNTTLKEFRLYSEAKDFLNSRLGVGVEWMSPSHIYDITQHGIRDFQEHYHVIAARGGPALVRSFCRLTAAALPELLASFPSFQAALVHLKQWLGASTVPDNPASQRGPQPVYKKKFFAVVDKTSGSGIVCNLKAAEKSLSESGRCVAFDQYKDARDFLNTELGLGIEWMTKWQLQSMRADSLGISGSRGTADGNDNPSLDQSTTTYMCFSVVDTLSGPEIIHTSYELEPNTTKVIQCCGRSIRKARNVLAKCLKNHRNQTSGGQRDSERHNLSSEPPNTKARLPESLSGARTAAETPLAASPPRQNAAGPSRASMKAAAPPDAKEDAAFAGLKGRELNGRSRQEGLSPCTDSGGGTEVPPHDGASAAQQQGKTEQQQLDEMLGLDADDSPAKDWLDHEADSSASRGGELESDRESENSGEEEASDYLGEFHTAADVSKAVSACQADIQGGASSPPAAASPAELPKPLDLRPLPIEDMSSIPPAERNMWILHNQIVDLSNRAIPEPRELAAVERVMQIVQRAAKQAFGSKAEAALFGSRMTGLALAESDVDIVVLGINHIKPPTPAKGFKGRQAKAVKKFLQRLLNNLLGWDSIVSHKFLKQAKVPIIKAGIRDDITGTILNVDICLGVASGLHAVRMIAEQVNEVKALRPLVLCVKAFLRQKGLGELYTGGLSSYAIFNLVMAHLQAEKAVAAEGKPCFGFLLWSFFHRFGISFDYATQAVSIQQGGVVPKSPDWHNDSSPWLLAIDDPQEPGQNIGAGSFNIRMIRAAMGAAADVLMEEAGGGAHDESAAAREARLWAAVQADGASKSPGDKPSLPKGLDPLGAIMDWRAEVTRGADGIRLREAAERLGRFQVTQAAETVHWLDTANQQIKSNRDVCDPSKSPRENPKLRNNKRKNDNSPAMAPLSKKARKKLKLNQKTPKKGDESIADRVARLHRQIR